MNRDQLITIGDLEKFKADMLSALSDLFHSNRNLTKTEWLKSADVRKLLKISPGTLQNLRITGKLPFKKIGGTMYYNAKDVEVILSA